MVNFLGASELFDDAFEPEQYLLIGGGDDSSLLIRTHSADISTYSPELKRDFQQFAAFDSTNLQDNVDLILGDASHASDLPTLYIGAGIVAPSLTTKLLKAYDVGEVPDKGCVWYVGGRDFSRTEQDWAMYNERLLPYYQHDLSTAIHSALNELGGRSYHLMFNIDVVDPVWAPAVAHPCGFGPDPRTVLKALRIVDGTPIKSLQVCGVYSKTEDNQSAQTVATARLAAEFARELALMAFPSKLHSVI